MSLTAEPSTATIHGHLLVDDEAHDLASGLLAFGKAVRELPGQLVHSDDMSLRLELQTGDRALRGTILMDQAGSGKIWVIEMREAPAGGRDRAGPPSAALRQGGKSIRAVGTVQYGFWELEKRC